MLHELLSGRRPGNDNHVAQTEAPLCSTQLDAAFAASVGAATWSHFGVRYA